MSDKNSNKERPEVYALRQDTEGWQISRRDFLKAAGISAAVVGVSMGSRFVRPAYAADDLESLCKDSLAHGNNITQMLLSPDGKYLISRDSDKLMKCWDFGNYALLGSVSNAFSGAEPDLTAYIDGTPAVISSRVSSALYYPLPLTDSSSSKSLGGNHGIPDFLVMDSAENIYTVKNKNVISRRNKADSYSGEETLVTLDESAKSLYFLNGSKKLFIQMEKGFGILDPKSGNLKTFDADIKSYAILPGESRALFCGSSAYALVSLINGLEVWSRPYSSLGGSPSIAGAAVSPDGTLGVIGTTGTKLWLISMANGSVQEEKSCGTSSGDKLHMVMAKDGSKLAVAVGKSILFISLPDFEIIGCPVDLKEMKDDVEGIKIEAPDPVTGQTITYTLPCGAPIPAGAVCVCNCVAGSVCSCVGHTVCTCDKVCSCVGHTVCTCDNVCSCVGHTVTYHYWHPN